MEWVRHRGTAFYLLFFLSGAAGLGYQVVWTRMFATGLGHELPATLAVITAFLAGMALGTGLCHRLFARYQNAGRLYGFLEAIIALWGFVSPHLIPKVEEILMGLLGTQQPGWSYGAVVCGISFLALLPATAAMGATFPVMERFISNLRAHGQHVGGLYATNTLGAVVGVMLVSFLLIAHWGLRFTSSALACLNLLCALTALALARSMTRRASQATSIGRTVHGRRADESDDNKVGGDEVTSLTSSGVATSGETPKSRSLLTSAPTGLPTLATRRLFLTAFVTGLLGIGFEVVGVRVLSQVFENTVYTFAGILALYLLGTAAGAAVYQQWNRHAEPRPLLAHLIGLLAVSCLLSVLVLSQAKAMYNGCFSMLGSGRLAALAAEMIVNAAVFTLPTALMGALFAHIVQNAKVAHAGIGRAAGFNLLGGALAGPLFAVLLLPQMGAKWTLVTLALGYLLLMPSMARARWVAPLLAIILVPLLPQLRFLPSKGKVIAYHEGIMETVAVVEEAKGERTLRLNNRFQMGGTAAAAAEYRQAHIPLLLHPRPEHVLFLGIGTGITMGGAVFHPGLKSEGVELVPEVVAVLPYFAPWNQSVHKQPDVRLHVGDARRYVRQQTDLYDVIVADVFHPARDGAGSLYTLEHFQAVRRRLRPEGLFCQWLPLYQLGDEPFRSILRTFMTVFPDATAYLLQFNVDTPVIGLVGYTSEPHYSLDWIEQRITDQTLREELRKLSLADSLRFFGHLVADSAQLKAAAHHAPLNTDDHPRVIFTAPEFIYDHRSAPYDRLLDLLPYGTPRASSVFAVPPDQDEMTTRLEGYWQARNIYLQGLIKESQGDRGAAVDAYVASAKLSEDFTPGYAQCLTLAAMLAKTEPEIARTLLRRLIEAQPQRGVAQELLRRLEER